MNSMLKPTWLIHDYDTTEFNQLKAALKFTETPYQEVIYKSSLDTLDKSNLPPLESCIVIHGSIQFVKALANQGFVYTPGAYGFSKETDCSNYYPKIPKECLLNYPYSLTTWAELKRSKEYFKKIFFNTSLFVRPNSGNKIFVGQNIYHYNWDENIKLIEDTSSVRDETLILVSNSKIIKPNEYRFAIIEKEVVTGSMYNWAKETSPEYPKETEELAKIVADQEWQLDGAYTCDIAFSPTGPKLIELNSFAAAGLYAMDKVKIVEAINKLAIKDYEEIYQ